MNRSGLSGVTLVVLIGFLLLPVLYVASIFLGPRRVRRPGPPDRWGWRGRSVRGARGFSFGLGWMLVLMGAIFVLPSLGVRIEAEAGPGGAIVLGCFVLIGIVGVLSARSVVGSSARYVRGDAEALGLEPERAAWGEIAETVVFGNDYEEVDVSMSGSFRGHPVLAAHLTVPTRQQMVGRVARYTVTAIRLDGDHSDVLVLPRSGAPLRTEPWGMEVTVLEWGEFNRVFQVRAHSRADAVRVLDAGLMAWLLDEGRGRAYELHGPWAVCFNEPRRGDLADQLHDLVGFCKHLPELESGMRP